MLDLASYQSGNPLNMVVVILQEKALREALILKNGKKRGHCPLLATPHPPKRVKRGHLLSDYRQKCVNGTRDSYCGVKSLFLSDLRLILTHIDSYCGVKSPFLSDFRIR